MFSSKISFFWKALGQRAQVFELNGETLAGTNPLPTLNRTKARNGAHAHNSSRLDRRYG